MGQAKKRGTEAERIAQAQARPKMAAVQEKQYTHFDYMLANQKVGSLFQNLTTPMSIDSHVIEFAAKLSNQEPIYLNCEPEAWSRQSCCDTNVEKYIEAHGGEMLCGYRIWYSEPDYIEGERHAVWAKGEVIRDVSFVDTGETRVVFVPDSFGFTEAERKVRHTFVKSRQEDLAKFDEIEKSMLTKEMTPEEAWAIMPSYEDWNAGKRSPNIFTGLSVA